MSEKKNHRGLRIVHSFCGCVVSSCLSLRHFTLPNPLHLLPADKSLEELPGSVVANEQSQMVEGLLLHYRCRDSKSLKNSDSVIM